MRNPFKLIGISTLLLLIYFAFGFAQEDQITITTYFPSPFGSYNELRTNRLAIGVGAMPTVDGVMSFPGLNGDPAFAVEGAIYYNSQDHIFMYHNGTGYVPMGQPCQRFTFNLNSGRQECPVGTSIALAPVDPANTNGVFLCCPFQ